MNSTSTFNQEVAWAAAQLRQDQTDVNEALVQKIFQCERAEEALRVSEGKLHALLAHQLSNREDERRRIAMEIHDTLGQNLLALRLDVAALYQHTSARQARLHDRVGAALHNLDDTIYSVRQLIAHLRPFQLELGLQAALEWEINKFQRDHGVACKVVGLEALHALAMDEVQLLTLYRVLQECLANIARHASASAVSITAVAIKKILNITISDNGIGIDPANPPPPAFGLMGMRERLRDAGGGFCLAPAAPHGTTVTITIPLFAQK
ncbi:sensor histidine kinase [Massilia sp. S19_KUP03_FR1]|uniref:sensor histidine kinase n=1 Tax=Massilia sp. S19_KUP03_FR1 TaxID=3025503 RepID=UPI002FCD8D08